VSCCPTSGSALHASHARLTKCDPHCSQIIRVVTSCSIYPIEIHVISTTRTLILTILAMMCFAGNSLLCRLALRFTNIDAASFTTIRLLSGALILWLIVRMRSGTRNANGSWLSGLALFSYAACFSFAYISLSAGTGALLLFGAVQVSMISYGLSRGEKFTRQQAVGLVISLLGLVGLLLPGIAAPPIWGAALMLAAGASWGVYSLRGRGVSDPIGITAGNFARALPFAVGLSLLTLSGASLDRAGVLFAVASGMLASGIGYAIWYTALRGLSSSSAAIIQLSVPVIAAIGGVAFLGEVLSMRLVVASIAILGGIILVLRVKKPSGVV
jgi:drug/metabolite transporter (DMT)-like permease